MLLTHIGRKSGRITKTVLEVIDFNEATGERLVISAYGEDANWYRNIRAGNAIEVQIGHTRFRPELRFPGVEETRETVLNYERKHGESLRRLLKIMGMPYDGSGEMRERLIKRFRLVSFRPPRNANSHSLTARIGPSDDP
jgi:deazaflavin-dependent oxidoreductase (nitroreductase family)